MLNVPQCFFFGRVRRGVGELGEGGEEKGRKGERERERSTVLLVGDSESKTCAAGVACVARGSPV
jgi:hypothetical protein